MRKQRLGLIQTPDQLRFSYIAILQVCISLYHHLQCLWCVCVCVVCVCQGAYNNLGLKNSLYEISEELQAEEKEEGEESESDEEPLISTDESKSKQL